MDKDISIRELIKSNGKWKTISHGPDSICVESYKLYWSDINEDFFEIIKKGLEDRTNIFTIYSSNQFMI